MDIDELSSFEEAMNLPSSSKLFAIMKDEMEFLSKNHVWDLVNLSSGQKAIGKKWGLKVKHKADGLIDKYKARLVVKGYTLKEGVDYDETFSLVVRFISICIILAIIVHIDLDLFEMDVKITFLNGEINKVIYVNQPIEFYLKG